jgi:DNA-binding NarL/FixJ family response regulator
MLHEGSKAVETILEENPDIILLDIMIPEKTGIEILKELYDKDPKWAERIVVITSSSTKRSTMGSKAMYKRARALLKVLWRLLSASFIQIPRLTILLR